MKNYPDSFLDFSLFTVARMKIEDIDWIYLTGGDCYWILKRLFEKRTEPKDAAAIVDRFYRINVC